MPKNMVKTLCLFSGNIIGKSRKLLAFSIRYQKTKSKWNKNEYTEDNSHLKGCVWMFLFSGYYKKWFKRQVCKGRFSFPQCLASFCIDYHRIHHFQKVTYFIWSNKTPSITYQSERIFWMLAIFSGFLKIYLVTK